MAQSSQTLTIIALRTVRYSDRHAILRAYSLERGSVALLLPAGAGREATRRRALLMPMSVAQCKADIRPTRDIHPFSDLMPVLPMQGVHSHPIKASLALFAAELLESVLREGEPDPVMFDFLLDTVNTLSSSRTGLLMNFHIALLRRLSHFLGIEPDFGSWTQGRIFDMTDGIFRPFPPSHGLWLESALGATVHALGRINYRNMHLYRFDRKQRNEILDTMLRYYSIHLVRLDALKTLPVLRTL